MAGETDTKSTVESNARQRVKDSFGALSYEDALVVAAAQVANDERVAAELSAAEKKSKAAKPKDA